MVRTLCWTPMVAVLICWGVFSSDLLALDWQMCGLRGGISDNRKDEGFKQYEGFAAWNLPWSRDLGSDWNLVPYLEANAGILKSSTQSAFVGSIGPGMYFTGLEGRISIYLGVNPTIISKHEFGDEDLGGPFQFTSHIGIDYNIARHFAIGYRLQHMSNFIFYESNPGLNLHMIEGVYRF